MSGTNGPDFAKIANAGINAWLAALPDDDWGDDRSEAISVHWDPTIGDLVEDEPSKTSDQE